MGFSDGGTQLVGPCISICRSTFPQMPEREKLQGRKPLRVTLPRRHLSWGWSALSSPLMGGSAQRDPCPVYSTSKPTGWCLQLSPPLDAGFQPLTR